MRQGSCWITWNASVRSRNLSNALEVGLHEICLSRGIVRHFVSALYTAWILYCERPRVVYIQYSFLLLIVVCLYKAMNRNRIVVVCDCHTKALRRTIRGPLKDLFGAVKVVSFQFVDICLIHNAVLTDEITRLHSHYYVLPDPVPDVTPRRRRARSAPQRCVYSSSFAIDEPREEIFALAALVDPGVQILWTGRPPPDFVIPETKPQNLTFTGYLAYEAYLELILESDCVLAMTSEEGCLQCAGFEAMAAATPLVVSDTRALRAYFGDAALYTDHRPESIRRAVTRALDDHFHFSRRLGVMAARRAAEFKDELLVLRQEVDARASRLQSAAIGGRTRRDRRGGAVREDAAELSMPARRPDVQ